MDKVKAAEPGVDNALSILHSQLADQQYIVGDSFTIADALLVPMLDYLLKMPTSKQLFENYESLKDYLHRVMDRPSFQQGVAAAA